jgi:cytochrome c oxidase subunit IV
MANEQGQQPATGVYLKVWGLLFVLAGASYCVGYFGIQGTMRWILIVALALLQAGLIVAILMHLVWERVALVYAILVPPPLLLIAFLGITSVDGRSTYDVRQANYLPTPLPGAAPAAEHR